MAGRFCADFETTTMIEDCRVWAAGIIDINNTKDFKYFNNIDDFMKYILKKDDCYIYFHNLKFDGEFIFYWLFENGFEHTRTREPEKGQFSTVISDKNLFYSIKICNGNNVITILDSLKILPFKIAELPKMFGLDIEKLDIEYTENREVGHILTQQEIDYLKNDVLIAALSLKVIFDEGYKKMTQGSNALHDYKKIVTPKMFKYYFPNLKELDTDIRRAYKGGFTYCSPQYKRKEIGEGIVLDVNSLYPSVMLNCELPFGDPIYYEGKYEEDKIYKRYIQLIRCQFELKKGYLPTIQIKNNLSFMPTEYLESSNDEFVELYLTDVDLSLFLEHYEIYNADYICGWKFRSCVGLFNDYIEKWYKVKEQATIEGNKGMRTFSKLMLNSLYGKFGLNPKVISRSPCYVDGLVKYVTELPEKRTPIYIPMAVFITSWARYITITSAQKVFDRFVYADTDSLHLIGTEIPKMLNISDTKIGAWKIEKYFTRAKFLRQKSYVEEVDGKLEVTCAGMPAQCYEYVTFDNFEIGSRYKGKLSQKHVKGGIVLTDIDFTIKP